jgi:hypothetical protein
LAQQLPKLLHKLLWLLLPLLLLLSSRGISSSCGAGVGLCCSGPASQQCSPLQHTAVAGPSHTSSIQLLPLLLLLLLLYRVHVSCTISCRAAVTIFRSSPVSQQCSPLLQTAAAAGPSHSHRCTNLAWLLLLLLQGPVLQECNSCSKVVWVSSGGISCLGCSNACLFLLLLLLVLFALLQRGYTSSNIAHAAVAAAI